jgi:hypothetical protein
MADKTISHSDMLDLCVAFDRENGMWPEDKYQGRSFYWFACEKLGYGEPVKHASEDSDVSDVHWETLLKANER